MDHSIYVHICKYVYMYEHNNIHMTTDKTVVLLLTVPFAVTKLKYFSISNFI